MFKRYMKKKSIFHLLPEKIGINPLNCIIYISLNRPENQFSCGVYIVYVTVRVI